jgi:hypothetical protein
VFLHFASSGVICNICIYAMAFSVKSIVLLQGMSLNSDGGGSISAPGQGCGLWNNQDEPS